MKKLLILIFAVLALFVLAAFAKDPSDITSDITAAPADPSPASTEAPKATTASTEVPTEAPTESPECIDPLFSADSCPLKREINGLMPIIPAGS